MSGLVLVVGALMLAAGGYEMFAGNGDILSERGWSAFIAGSVLVAGGVVTMALGLAVRALERLRGAIVGGRPFVRDERHAVRAERLEPGTASPDAIAAPTTQADLFHDPIFDEAPTMPVPAPIEHAALAHEPVPAPIVVPPPPPAEHTRHHEMPEPAAAEPRDDWLDHSFAELEREMAARPESVEAAAPVHPEPVAAMAEPAPHATHELPVAPVHETPAAIEHHEAPVETAPHEPPAHAPHMHDTEPAPAEQATVSAREAPVESAVIGRYESEGTSYVMYADGSIDAQSAAGVYRFASMAELKSFIES